MSLQYKDWYMESHMIYKVYHLSLIFLEYHKNEKSIADDFIRFKL